MKTRHENKLLDTTELPDAMLTKLNIRALHHQEFLFG
jgi:hypothetical protein